jgi:hypothetical protein
MNKKRIILKGHTNFNDKWLTKKQDTSFIGINKRLYDIISLLNNSNGSAYMLIYHIIPG